MLSVETLKNIKWMLDPEIAYFNHGSFGARPTVVFEGQIALKHEFERSPIKFLDREGKDRLAWARNTIAQFLDCSENQLGFVENATTGVACILQSLQFPPGFEIVTTSHVYNGVRQLLRSYCHRNGSIYREIEIRTPLKSNVELVEAIVAGISNNTKLLVIDHVTSATGIVFPVKEIVAECNKRGVAVVIDGAHAPGMLDLSIDELSPDWYVGNLHKWVCGPPGAGFLWVNKKYIDSTHPLTVSHFYEQGFTEEFDWQGTRDITSILGAAIAVDWGNTIGWENIRTHNHELVVEMQQRLVKCWGGTPLSPLDGSMIGSMATVELPTHFPIIEDELKKIQMQLYHHYKVEAPLMPWQEKPVIRLSAQLYTKIDDIERLLLAIDGIS
jgi:isopenicillin-N epimerase